MSFASNSHGQLKGHTREYVEHTDRHSSDTYPFLQNLKPNHKLHTTTKVELSRRATTSPFRHHIPEHMEVAVEFAGFPLEFCYVANILEFCLGKTIFVFTAEASEDVASFSFAANFDEPTR